jgi:hypothetical protein
MPIGLIKLRAFRRVYDAYRQFGLITAIIQRGTRPKLEVCQSRNTGLIAYQLNG